MNGLDIDFGKYSCTNMKRLSISERKWRVTANSSTDWQSYHRHQYIVKYWYSSKIYI